MVSRKQHLRQQAKTKRDRQEASDARDADYDPEVDGAAAAADRAAARAEEAGLLWHVLLHEADEYST